MLLISITRVRNDGLVPFSQVSSNVDRGPLARKRDVGFVYHNNRLRELQQQAAELEIENPYPPPAKQATSGY